MVFFSWTMQILLAISILCFVALVCAGAAVMGHSNSGHKNVIQTASLDLRGLSKKRDFSHHLLAAVEDKDRILTRSIPRQTVQDIAARKSWNQLSDIATVRPSATIRSTTDIHLDDGVLERRRSTLSAYGGRVERLNWAYFNKDIGDLIDPYETLRVRVNSRTASRRY